MKEQKTTKFYYRNWSDQTFEMRGVSSFSDAIPEAVKIINEKTKKFNDANEDNKCRILRTEIVKIEKLLGIDKFTVTYFESRVNSIAMNEDKNILEISKKAIEFIERLKADNTIKGYDFDC